ncbi:MAG: hypothetical protein JW884_14875 [Deltaproteobacteria bacterium]|nr:hypothetical protein [Deltaproteobacteria bacterium]
MTDDSPLKELLAGGGFRFQPLKIAGIDNEPIFRLNEPEMAQQEICLFHDGVASGDEYAARLHGLIEQAMTDRKALPVVRFADGEYAFYRESLHCNGLYKQAESVAAIKEALPRHIDHMRILAATGLLAPLVHPGNSQPRKKGLLSLFRKDRGEGTALSFLDFLRKNGIALTGLNYIPFYVVYAYLATPVFRRAMNNRRICIATSDFDEQSCLRWFAEADSAPELIHIPIPESCVATRWESMAPDILARLPGNCDLCLVGAGIGSLGVCVDAAQARHIPAIDGGHVLNMMNGRVDKSAGPRLYTLRREAAASHDD